MIAMLKINCPHCGVAGQVLMPPPGAIIIGPCPECSGLVAIFAGKALPLDNTIMTNSEIKEKYEHVLHVLSGYVETQVRQCFSQPAPGESSDMSGDDISDTELQPITEGEIQRFVQTELRELDSPEFFNHFG